MQKYLVLIALLVTLLPGYSQSPVALIRAYEKAHNAHDVERSLDFYNDTVAYELSGVWVKKGKDQIRELEEWDAALNSNLKFESIAVHKDSLFCMVVEKNDWFKAVGIDQLVHNPTVFIVKDGSIHKIIATPSAEDRRKIDTSINSIFDWSLEVNDSSVFGLIQNEEFIYSNQSAKQWLTLFKKWDQYKRENPNE